MAGIQAPERRIDQLAVGQGARDIGRRRRIDRSELDLDRATLSTASKIEARVDGQTTKPGIEPVRIAETRQVTPGPDECLLDRVARELRVAEDQSGRRVQPRERRVDESGEGVMIASLRSIDECSLVHGRLDCDTT
jgi:hypothetical protein